MTDHRSDYAVQLPTCGRCYMIVCDTHKRIIEQCGCTSARKERTDVPCPGGCWTVSADTVRVPCPRCGDRIALRKDGTVRTHGYGKGSLNIPPCEGSGAQIDGPDHEESR